MYEDFIRERIVKLRMERGVSAREMSLSMGQSASYVNNIENRRARPSLTGLFYICEYFGITAQEFFNTNVSSPGRIRDLVDAASYLKDDELDHLTAITRAMGKRSK